MPDHSPCDICGDRPHHRYVCRTCRSAVCGGCRTPIWLDNAGAHVCVSECRNCHSDPDSRGEKQ